MKKLSLLLLFFLLYSLFSIPNSYAATPKPSASPKIATDSADIDPEMIKENIKKRMEEVIKNQTTSINKKQAYNGTVTSITTNSITLDTSKGVEQASTSASLTTYIELPQNKEVQVGEISIGDYVTALGFTSEDSKVLDARRVLVLRNPPPSPTNTIIYGTITNIDSKKNTLIVENSKLQQKRILNINTKSKYQIVDSLNHRQNISFKNLAINNSVLVVFNPDDNTNESGTLLLLTLKSSTEISLNPTPEPSPSPTPKVVKKP